jgi:hypothetical protein
MRSTGILGTGLILAAALIATLVDLHSAPAAARQQLPSNRTVSWTQPAGTTANPVPDGYRIVLDNGPTFMFPACTPDPLVCSVQVPVATLGGHTLVQTPFINSNPTTGVLGGDGQSTTITFSLVSPGKSGNLQIR